MAAAAVAANEGGIATTSKTSSSTEDQIRALITTIQTYPTRVDVLISALKALQVAITDENSALVAAVPATLQLIVAATKKSKDENFRVVVCGFIGRLCMFGGHATVVVIPPGGKAPPPPPLGEMAGRVVKAGCLDAIMQVLKASSTGPCAPLHAALDALASFVSCVGMEAAKKAAAAVDFSLLAATQPSTAEDAETVKAALRVVAQLVRHHGDNVKKAGPSLEKVRQAMERHMMNPAVVCSGISAMAEVWKRSAPAAQVQSLGGSVVQAMRRHHRVAAIQKVACGAIGVASRASTDGATAMGRLGSIEAVLGALADHMDDVGVVVHALGAISDSTGPSCPENAAKAGAAGAAEQLILVLQKYSSANDSSGKVASYVARAVASLCLSNPDMAMQFWARNLFKLLEHSMRRNVDQVELQAAACTAFARCLEASTKARSQNNVSRVAESAASIFIPSILTAMTTYPQNAPLQKFAAMALKFACEGISSREERARLFSSEHRESIRAATTDAMRGHIKEPEIQIIGSQLLTVLS